MFVVLVVSSYVLRGVEGEHIMYVVVYWQQLQHGYLKCDIIVYIRQNLSDGRMQISTFSLRHTWNLIPPLKSTERVY